MILLNVLVIGYCRMSCYAGGIKVSGKWINTNAKYVEQFLGIKIVIGIVKMWHYYTYWKTDSTIVDIMYDKEPYIKYVGGGAGGFLWGPWNILGIHWWAMKCLMHFDPDARVIVLSNQHKIQLLWQIFFSNLSAWLDFLN